MSYDLDNKDKTRTIRLNKSLYTRPNQTITDTLQNPDAYKEKLKGYTEVKDVDYVSINTHVRYFVYDLDENRWKFRTGGLLKRKHQKYVVLSNGKYTWSVQREITNVNTGDVWETKFFKILSKQELTEIALERQQEEIDRLRKENQHLVSQIHAINK